MRVDRAMIDSLLILYDDAGRQLLQTWDRREIAKRQQQEASAQIEALVNQREALALLLKAGGYNAFVDTPASPDRTNAARPSEKDIQAVIQNNYDPIE